MLFDADLGGGAILGQLGCSHQDQGLGGEKLEPDFFDF